MKQASQKLSDNSVQNALSAYAYADDDLLFWKFQNLAEPENAVLELSYCW